MFTKDRIAAWSPYLLSVLRIVVALLFIEHGTMKLLGFPPSNHVAGSLISLEGVSGILELVGGLLLLPGLFTRPVAFILSGEMAAAYFIAHAPKSFFPAVNMGELAVVYSFVLLYFATAGAGPLSVDERLERRENSRAGSAREIANREEAPAKTWRHAA